MNDDLREKAERRYLVLESNFTIVDQYAAALDEAEQLIAKYRLRVGDAIQLACAILGRRTAGDLQFVTEDGELIYAARAEGFAVITTLP